LLLLTTPAYDSNNAVVGWVQLMWSNKCQSNWGVVTPNSGYSPDFVQIYRGGDRLGYSNYCTSSPCASGMVYAPTVCAGTYGAVIEEQSPYNVAYATAKQNGC
jgi:hypothetical protein